MPAARAFCDKHSSTHSKVPDHIVGLSVLSEENIQSTYYKTSLLQGPHRARHNMYGNNPSRNNCISSRLKSHRFFRTPRNLIHHGY